MKLLFASQTQQMKKMHLSINWIEIQFILKLLIDRNKIIHRIYFDLQYSWEFIR